MWGEWRWEVCGVSGGGMCMGVSGGGRWEVCRDEWGWEVCRDEWGWEVCRDEWGWEVNLEVGRGGQEEHYREVDKEGGWR